MSPKSLLSRNVGHGELVQADQVQLVGSIQRDQDREGQESEPQEEEKRLVQELEEHVGIEAAEFNKLRVAVVARPDYPAKKALDRAVGPVSLRAYVGSWSVDPWETGADNAKGEEEAGGDGGGEDGGGDEGGHGGIRVFGGVSHGLV